VIGRNGSGKSTMFQMLAGVTAPTEGTVRVQGRVAPLISVGIGFHPELTGRENVYVNGMILGLTKREIDARFDSILDFAGVEEFIDTPVKFYSSGMFVRLGFSVAVSVDPEVLLVDEVLAVGDLAFQAKCFDRMDEIRRNGATILVVSHNLNAIRRLCSRVLLLHDGLPRFLGETDEGISKYHDLIGTPTVAGEDTAEVQIAHFEICDSTGKLTSQVKAGEEVLCRARVRFSQATDTPVFLLRVNKDSGQEVYAENTPPTYSRRVEAGETVALDIRFRAALPTATYFVQIAAGMGAYEGAPKAVGKAIGFFVGGRSWVKGTNDLEGSFEFGRAEPYTDGLKAALPSSPKRKASVKRKASAAARTGHRERLIPGSEENIPR